MKQWNRDDHYLDLSPDEEKDKKIFRQMINTKKYPEDFNAPMIGEQLIKNCFAVKTSNLYNRLKISSQKAFD